MFVVTSLLAWWYGPGFLQLVSRIKKMLAGIMELFSVRQLLGSMFAPYRQIGTDRAIGSVKVQLQAWLDKEFSRVMGFVFRSILIVFGLFAFVFMAAVAVIIIVGWFILPAVPIVGFLLTTGSLF